ncbi:hypothetical protein MAR_017538, partial [Mya arenaria]
MAYNAESLKKAVSAVKRNELSLRKASAEYGVPAMTIHDNAKGAERSPRRRGLDMKPGDEAAKIQWCLYIANQDHATRISTENAPTNNWIRSFLIRHPVLSVRLAEDMDRSRASMSTQEVIDQFYKIFAVVLVEHDLLDKPDRVFRPKHGHVFRKKVTGSGHITTQICASAAGRVLPTLVLFPGLVRVFIPHCGKVRPVLLVMDNHDSQVPIKTILTARDNGVILLGLAGHTTHFLQPLYVK